MDAVTLEPARWPFGARIVASITFDGGYADTIDAAVASLDHHDVPATWFLVAGSIGGTLEGRAVAGWDWWQARLETSADEIGNHSLTHPVVRPTAGERLNRAVSPHRNVRRARRLLSGQPRRASAQRSRTTPEGRRASVSEAAVDARLGRMVLEWQLAREITTFAFPSGQTQRKLRRRLLDDGHVALRGTAPGTSDHTVDLGCVPSFVWERSHTEADMARTSESLASTGGWVVDTFHRLGHSASYAWTTTPELFTRRIEALKDVGATFATFGTVAGHLRAAAAWRQAIVEEGPQVLRRTMDQASRWPCWFPPPGDQVCLMADGRRLEESGTALLVPAGTSTIEVARC